MPDFVALGLVLLVGVTGGAVIAIFDLEQVARPPQVADAARTYFEHLFFQVPAPGRGRG